jgi:hypothetical protein
MKKFLLKSKDGEVIHSILKPTKDEAVTYFSHLKGIPEKALVKIYKIEKE